MSFLDVKADWLKTRIIIYALFILIGSLLRFWLISGNNVLFWFDQARDAIIVQQMVEERDIKLQGPSASGTDDTVFHGVLYYYIIAPLYAVAGGNPQVVSGLLGIISMLALIPIGELVWHLSKSRFAFIVALLLFTFSVDSTQMGTWLSNPTIALVTIPAFFYFLYRVFWQNKNNELWLVTLFLGLSHQAVIFTVYLFGVLAIAWWMQRSRAKKYGFSIKQVVVAGLVYLITIGTMLLTQLLLIARGIFDPLAIFGKLNNVGLVPYDIIVGTINSYTNIIGYSIFPTKPLLSLFLFIGLIWFVFTQLPAKIRYFFLLFFLGPLILISWQYRNSYHTFIGITPLLYVFIAVFFSFIKDKLYLGKYIVIGMLLLFITTNLQQLKYSHDSGQHPVAIQTGTTLKDKLDLIDYTYQVASSEPFTISSFTSPYDYNTTWAYLYSWYGRDMYGYTPKFVGPSQIGIFGGQLLEEQTQPEQIHFALYEPLGGIPVYLQDLFSGKQNSISVLQEEKQFGSMFVEKRAGN